MRILEAVNMSFLSAVLFPALVWAADCGCVTVGIPLVFTEDPIILANEAADYHAEVEEVYYDAGECVIFITFPDGALDTYTEASGHTVQRLGLAPHVAEHPAFAGLGNELTLGEVTTAALRVCSPNDEPTS